MTRSRKGKRHHERYSKKQVSIIHAAYETLDEKAKAAFLESIVPPQPEPENAEEIFLQRLLSAGFCIVNKDNFYEIKGNTISIKLIDTQIILGAIKE